MPNGAAASSRTVAERAYTLRTFAYLTEKYMQNKWLVPFLVSGLLVGMSGCPDVNVDPGEGVDDPIASGPIVEFDPSNRIIPFPNNLLLDRATGKVNLPASCNESAASMATRVGVLNKLDGFGTFETVMTVTFNEPVDIATVAANVSLFRRATGAMAVDPTAAMAIPVVAIPSMTARLDATCMNPAMINQVILVPTRPLDQKSTYVVALKSGIKTSMGADFGPSFTWSLIRQEAPLVELDAMGNVISDRTPLDPSIPEDLASLQGIDLLWKAHAQAMTFLRGASVPTENVLLAWEFNTQTVTDALDPAVASSPAASVNTMPLTGPVDAAPVPVSISAAAANRSVYPYLACTTAAEVNDTQCFLKMALGLAATMQASCNAAAGCDAAYAAGNATCAAVGCAAVGNVLAGRVRAKQFQALRDNPAVPARKIPGQWSDPVKPTAVGDELLTALIFVPATPAPATGRQIAVYQHGLGSNKESVFAIGPQLASVGFATISIDAVAHGSRAVQSSVEPTLGCSGTPSVAAAAQCFSPFLSPDLGTTRDNIRQTIVDHHSLTAALEACGLTNCGSLTVDPAHIVYIGISLGGIMGSITAAVNPDIKASVLNVPGVGWVDILENTQTLPIRCSLVNGLIDAGILMGEKWAGGTTGLCTTDAWKTQPGYRQFSAIGRWVLDPADPANFTRKLAARRFLIQEVVGDLVVPNVATRNMGALVGLMPVAADCGAPNAAPPPAMLPSAAILNMPMTNKWLQYTNSTAAMCAPVGNVFEHASLLRPSGTGTDGRLGTQRLQTDALTFLNANR